MLLKKKPTRLFILMSFSSLFTLLFFLHHLPHATPTTCFGCFFLCFYGRKLDDWNEKKIGRLGTMHSIIYSFANTALFKLLSTTAWTWVIPFWLLHYQLSCIPSKLIEISFQFRFSSIVLVRSGFS